MCRRLMANLSYGISAFCTYSLKVYYILDSDNHIFVMLGFPTGILSLRTALRKLLKLTFRQPHCPHCEAEAYFGTTYASPLSGWSVPLQPLPRSLRSARRSAH